MKMRKVVSAMLVAAMATGMVAGCGSNNSGSKNDNASKSDAADASKTDTEAPAADAEATGDDSYLFVDGIVQYFKEDKLLKVSFFIQYFIIIAKS